MKLLIFYSLFLYTSAKVPPFKSINPQIFGGVDADIHEFPSMVSIQWNRTHSCAGNLISEFWILTAAHCRYPLEAWFEIEYGVSELLFTDEKAKIAQIELFIIHEDFTFEQGFNDIGVIKTVEPIHTGFHNQYSKIGFPGAYYPTGTPATAIGWGIWSYKNMTFPPLQKIDFQIFHYRDCKTLMLGNPLGLEVWRKQICAGKGDFLTGSCEGDSGSPLFVNGVQVGITSWGGIPCDEEKFPTVFTEVASFIDWIEEKTKLDFKLQKFLYAQI